MVHGSLIHGSLIHGSWFLPFQAPLHHDRTLSSSTQDTDDDEDSEDGGEDSGGGVSSNRVTEPYSNSLSSMQYWPMGDDIAEEIGEE